MTNEAGHNLRRLTAALSSLAAALLCASSLLAADEPVQMDDAVTPPRRIVFVKPEYPEAAKKERLEGKVILEMVVGRDGGVEAAKIIKSNPTFNAAAMAAAVQWRYEPALKDGKPVSVYLTVIIEFELKEDEKGKEAEEGT